MLVNIELIKTLASRVIISVSIVIMLSNFIDFIIILKNSYRYVIFIIFRSKFIHASNIRKFYK